MLIPMNHTNEAHSRRLRDRIANRYAYVAIPAGTMSVFFSFGSLITNAKLVFPVGYLRSRASVNLTVGEPLLNMTLWTLSLILFLIYPIVIRESRPTRPMLVSHGILLIILLSTWVWPEILWALSLANIIVAMSALLASSRTFGVARTRTFLLSLVTLLLFLIPVEVLALSEELSNPGAVWKALWLYAQARLDLSLYNLAFYATPYLVVLLMLSPIIAELMNPWLKRAGSSGTAHSTTSHLHNCFALALGLVGVVLLAGLVGYFPYFLTQDSGRLFGVDVPWYVQQLDALQRGKSIPLIAQNPRAAYLLLLHGLRSLAGLSISQTLASGSALVTILFATSSFFLVRETGQGNSAAVLAGLLAAVAPQTLVAARQGILANWLAVAEMLFFLALLLNSIRTGSRIAFVGCLVASLFLMMTHTYTWVVLVMTLTVHLALLVARHRSWRPLWRSQSFRALLVLISMALVILLVWGEFASLRSVLIFLTRETIDSQTSPTGFLTNIQIALTVFGAEHYSNWLLLSLSVVGVFSLSKMESESRTLLSSLILTPSLACFLVNATLQWRLLFLMPYHVFAALGLFSLLGVMGRAATDRADTALHNTLRIASCTFLVLLFLNNTIRFMAIIATG